MATCPHPLTTTEASRPEGGQARRPSSRPVGLGAQNALRRHQIEAGALPVSFSVCRYQI